MKIFGTKKFYVAASLASASLLSTVQSTSKCADGTLMEDGGCHEVVKRQASNNLDLPNVLSGLLSPGTISNHFTDILLFQSVIAIGWVTALAVYQILINLNLSPESKKRVEEWGFWFSPDNVATSEGINIRNTIFGFFLGRVMFNVITDPQGTRDELNSITWTELRNRMLSNDYLLTWTGRFAFQFLLVMTGISVLYSISVSNNYLFGPSNTWQNVSFRKFASQGLDDLNDSVQAGLSKNYF